MKNCHFNILCEGAGGKKPFALADLHALATGRSPHHLVQFLFLKEQQGNSFHISVETEQSFEGYESDD